MDEWRKKAGWAGFAVAGEKLIAAAKSSRNKSLEAFIALDKKCLNCNTPITYGGRRNDYCSHKCSAICLNRKRRKVKICTACKEREAVFPKKRCQRCIDNGRHVAILENAGADELRRHILIDEHGHKCWVCNNTEWNDMPIPLELDHINGDSDDNDRLNLRVICPNCHAQTPTYKARNKVKGSTRKVYRKMRLERANRLLDKSSSTTIRY